VPKGTHGLDVVGKEAQDALKRDALAECMVSRCDVK